MAREMTVDELAAVRSDYQFSRLFLAIHNPTVIFTCQVNQTFASLDRINEVIYDNSTGTRTNILPGMTVWVGSTPGAWDLGQVRVRDSASATRLYVGENADVPWADNLYLTVVDEFGVWAKHPRVISDTEIYMDWDVAYSNQHTAFAPVPVFEHQVLWLTGASVSTTLDASASWCPAAGAKSYSWVATGGTLTGATTATPTFEATATGVYRLACTVTVGTASATGYRFVFVYSSVNPPFLFTTRAMPSGSYDRGGWESAVSITDPVGLDIVRDRALCIIFAVDYYNSVEGSIGPVPGSENIIQVGWIAGESLVINPVQGSASFEIKGPHHFISALEEFIDGLEDTPSTPDAWTEIKNLTVDKCLWHLITWRSTVASVISVTLTGDTRQASELQAGEGDLWSQISRNAAPIAAKPCADRYGRVYVEINQQLIPESGRTAIPEVLQITKADWTGQVSVIRNTMSRTGQILLSGIKYSTGNTASAFFSLAPGHVFKRYGPVTSVERLLLESQAKSNELAGLTLGWHNREYDFEFTIAGNNRMVDICPMQYVSVEIAPEDNPRGITYSGRMVVREITFDWREKESFLSPVWFGEQETFPENSTNGDVPDVDDWDSSIPPLPELPPLPPLPVIYPPPDELPTNQPTVVVGYSAAHGVFFTSDFDEDSPTWYLSNEGLSESDKAQIGELIVTPGGNLYLMTGGDHTTGWQYVYRAEAVGGAWSLIFDSSADYPQTGSFVFGIGYNPLVTDSVCVFGGRPWSWPFDGNIGASYIATGSGGTLALSGVVTEYFRGTKSTVLWATNGWYILTSQGTGIVGSFSSGYVLRVNSAGALVGSADLSTAGGADRFGCGAGTLDLIFEWEDGGGGGGGYTEIVNTTPTFSSAFAPTNNQGLSFSRDGLHAMGNAGGTPYKTSDGGASWELASGTIPTGSDVWASCGDNYRWIFGGGMIIKLTMDFGVTVPLDKTGNLTAIAPLVDVTGLRFIS